jgi:hypothetical protein
LLFAAHASSAQVVPDALLVCRLKFRSLQSAPRFHCVTATFERHLGKFNGAPLFDEESSTGKECPHCKMPSRQRIIQISPVHDRPGVEFFKCADCGQVSYRDLPSSDGSVLS